MKRTAENDRKNLLLLAEAALCILWTVLLAGALIRMYLEGSALRAAGQPETLIFTGEKITAAFFACSPVLLAAVILGAVCAAKGVNGGKDGKPVRDPELVKTCREGTGITADAQAVRRLRLAVLALALAFILAGIFNGSMEDVLIKAVNICTECIGLG